MGRAIIVSGLQGNDYIIVASQRLSLFSDCRTRKPKNVQSLMIQYFTGDVIRINIRANLAFHGTPLNTSRDYIDHVTAATTSRTCRAGETQQFNSTKAAA
jgi:hypothetical protein